jgi:hypothetical protein
MPESPNGENYPADIVGLALTAFTLGLTCLVSACGAAQQRSAPATMTAADELAVASRAVDCEWKAANRYDDGSYTISELARRVMGVCAVERAKARSAFHLPSNDPQIELDEFKQAVETVENARKARIRANRE